LLLTLKPGDVSKLTPGAKQAAMFHVIKISPGEIATDSTETKALEHRAELVESSASAGYVINKLLTAASAAAKGTGG